MNFKKYTIIAVLVAFLAGSYQHMQATDTVKPDIVAEWVKNHPWHAQFVAYTAQATDALSACIERFIEQHPKSAFSIGCAATTALTLGILYVCKKHYDKKAAKITLLKAILNKITIIAQGNSSAVLAFSGPNIIGQTTMKADLPTLNKQISDAAAVLSADSFIKRHTDAIITENKDKIALETYYSNLQNYFLSWFW